MFLFFSFYSFSAVSDDDPHAALRAPAEKELAWIRAHGRPRFPFDRAYRETFDYRKQDPEEHARSLSDYLQLTPHLVPTCSKLSLPILRHPDLQPKNIFVSKDLTITGLIDWQHSSVLPTFVAAGMPRSFQNYGDEQSMSFVGPPQLPDDFESMFGDERSKAYEQFRRRHVHYFYLAFTQAINEPHWQVFEQEASLLKGRIFDNAGSPWEGLNTPLQVDITRVSQNWSKIAAAANSDSTGTGTGTVPDECPVVVGEQDAQRRVALEESLRDVDSDMERINGAIGTAADGWTSTELFEEARKRAQLIKEEGLAAVEDDAWLREMTDRHWPFDGFDEDE